jgi:hypothetical protein
MQRRIKVRKIDMPQLVVRIPVELKEKLEARAFENNRSVTAEVTKMIEDVLNEKNNSPFTISMTISEQLANLAEKVSELEQRN